MSSANDLMFGGAAPAVKFPEKGDKITGVIVAEEGRQRNAYDPTKPGSQGGPLWWSGGRPVELDAKTARNEGLRPVEDPVLTLVQVTEDAEGNLTVILDPEVEGDDGRRRLFIASRIMFQAIKSAVLETKTRGFTLGAILTVEHTGMGKPARKGARAPKDYTAAYKLPTDASLAILKDANGADDAADADDPDDPWS